MPFPDIAIPDLIFMKPILFVIKTANRKRSDQLAYYIERTETYTSVLVRSEIKKSILYGERHQSAPFEVALFVSIVSVAS